MRIDSIDLTTIAATVRRHEALERFARYMLLYNIAIFLWAATPPLLAVRSAADLGAVVSQESWRFAYIVLASVAATYLFLAHRWLAAYAIVFIAQVAYFFTPSPDKQIFVLSVMLPYSVATNPAMQPLAPLATMLGVMTATFCYVMAMFVLYSLAWIVHGRRVPAAAFGPPAGLLAPLGAARLLDTRLAGQRSQRVAAGEALMFALASLLFVAASMAFFYGVRRVQNAFATFAGGFTGACAPTGVTAETAEAVVACIASHYPWSRAATDLGAPLLVTAAVLAAANIARRIGRRRFLARLAERPVAPEGSTLFLRAFRDDQVRMRRAGRNLFSLVFDLGRSPATLDELMLERLDGQGDLIAIGNPADRRGLARSSPWGAHRLYVDDADWQATAARLAAAADRIILCVDASDGVRWEIGHVLHAGHAGKTLFVFNPALDAATRTRLLVEDFACSATSVAAIDVQRLVALAVDAAGDRTLLLARRPAREAFLVAARLAFAPGAVAALRPPPAAAA